MFSRRHILLGVVLLVAVTLRLWGIAFGLPRIQHIDEGGLIHTALYMAGNWGRPNIYVHGTVMPGMVAFFSGASFAVGRVIGIFADRQDFLVSFFRDPSLIVLSGRLVNVVFSLATVWFLYLTGAKIFGKRVGLLASLFLAVSVLHVKESHYAKPDVLSGLTALGIYSASWFLLKTGTMRAYLTAGALVGLGVGTKATMAFAGITPLIAHVLRKRRNIRRLAVFFSCALLTFFVVSPYAFLDARFFTSELVRWQETVALPRGYPHSPLWYYLFEYLREGTGLGVFLLSGAGLFAAFFSKRRREGILIAAFPMLFLVSVNVWSKEHVQRYALPILPQIVLLAAVALDRLLAMTVPRRATLALLVFLPILLWQPLVRSIKFDYLVTRPTTGELVTAWIEEHVPAETAVAVEGTLQPFYQPSSGPYLSLTAGRMQEFLDGGGDGAVVLAIASVSEGAAGYDILATPNLGYAYDQQLGEWDLARHGRYTDVSSYLDRGVEVLVANSWAHSDTYPWSQEFSASLGEEYRVVHEIRPTVAFAHEPHAVRMDYAALDSVTPGLKDMITGPTFTIYRQR